MEHTDFDGIIFADTLQDFNALRHTGRVIHILCSGGNMGFTFQDTRYHIAAGDYVILPNATLGSDFSDSGDFMTSGCANRPCCVSGSVWRIKVIFSGKNY